jgi:hypothetical protein
MAADPTRIEDRIKSILNACKAWGGIITVSVYFADEITAVRIEAGWEVLRAIAESPQNGCHGSLCTPIPILNNAFLPAHDGEPGIPMIVPFTGATAQAGDPATASQISSYREDPLGLYALDPVTTAPVAHDAADSQGLPSPVSCRYAIVKGRFQFTGKTAEIPLIQLSRAMADTGVPANYEPTVIKLAIPKLRKEGTNLGAIAQGYAQAGADDLAAIRAGAMTVSPVPDIESFQRAEAA